MRSGKRFGAYGNPIPINSRFIQPDNPRLGVGLSFGGCSRLRLTMQILPLLYLVHWGFQYPVLPLARRLSPGNALWSTSLNLIAKNRTFVSLFKLSIANQAETIPVRNTHGQRNEYELVLQSIC